MTAATGESHALPEQTDMQQHRELSLRPLRGSDAEILAGTFAAIGWDKPAAQLSCISDEQGGAALGVRGRMESA